MKRNHAFTLIELLVVIAIIAILAAILFPVFAQAKTAAKAANELSNEKQQATAIQLYLGDNDDALPFRGTPNWEGWGNGNCNGDTGCASWDKLIQPYTKNWALFDSGLDASTSVPTPFGNIKRSFRAAKNVFTAFGIGGGKKPLNASALPAPAGTIALTNQRNEGVYGGTWWIWSTWYENWIWWTGSDNTRANNPAFRTPFAGDTTAAELGGPNNYWGGVDISASNSARFAFMDGHVKAHPKGYIFPGYDRRANAFQTVNNAFPGVCLDAFEWNAATSGTDGGRAYVDCPVPQN